MHRPALPRKARLALGAVLALCCLLPARAAGASFEEISAAARAARDANDVPRAIELYRQGVNVNPEWPEGWWFLGSMLYDSDQYAGARDALARFVQLQPDAAPAWGLLGLSEFETGDYGKALVHVQRALGNTTAVPAQMQAVLRYHEAVLLADAGQFDAALQKYAAIARVASPTPPLVAGIGLAALRRALVPGQIPSDQREIVTAAGSATFLMLTQKYSEAGESLRTLVSRFPDSPGVHYLYGCYLLASAPEHAIGELTRELALAPSNAAASGMLAWALLNRRDAARSLPYAKQAAAATPESATAQYVLGRALAETGDVANGIAHLETAARLEPSNLETHLALASAYSKAGRTEEARRERARSIDLSKGNVVAQQ